MQIYQGNFVADIEPIKSKQRFQPTHFRIRVSQLPPVELLISDSVATDAHAARERSTPASTSIFFMLATMEGGPAL